MSVDMRSVICVGFELEGTEVVKARTAYCTTPEKTEEWESMESDYLYKRDGYEHDEDSEYYFAGDSSECDQEDFGTSCGFLASRLNYKAQENNIKTFQKFFAPIYEERQPQLDMYHFVQIW